MTVWAEVLWLTLGAGLVLYAVTGGADLGAGLWSLVATGPRKELQREMTRKAIAPIWEANHVWLIFVIVVMFSAFSRAFSVISISLHIPIALALVGLVFRGAAFSFHAYGIQPDPTRHRWSLVFTWSSIVTPVFLGMVVGAVGTGDIRVTGREVTTGFLAGWTTPFAWMTGLFALALFSMLAAVYLAAETGDPRLRRDFRLRAYAAEVVSGVLAALVLWRASIDAPPLYENLVRSSFTWPVQSATAAAALLTLVLLFAGREKLARVTCALQVALVVVGWGLAMDHHFVLPDVSAERAVMHSPVLPAFAIALACGALVLAPALFYLFHVFKLRGR